MSILRAFFCLVWVIPLVAVGWIIGLTILPIIGGVLMIKESFYVPSSSVQDDD